MNNLFYKLNNLKIKFMLKFISAVMGGFYIILYSINVIQNPANFEISTFLTYLVFFAFGMPILIFLLAYISWIYKHNKRKNIFGIANTNSLVDLEFEKTLKNVDTKWYFTEEILMTKKNNFCVKLDLKKENTSILEFETQVAPVEYTDKESRRIIEIFKTEKIIIIGTTITKEFKLKEFKSVKDIEHKLNKMTEILIQQNILPE